MQAYIYIYYVVKHYTMYNAYDVITFLRLHNFNFVNDMC